ncbi:hypothetical protein FJZ48_01195 [Candidatus Uhrbacteria bacterium]|nr:hypothetical protein [Candidatus Uhrbacteria bacterium]
MIQYNHDHENEITLFAETNFRNQRRRFGIKTDDRRRHVYVIGKTGTGKTTLLENMLLSDVYAGHGCCYIDPHGDTAEKLLDFIPSHRMNDVVYFNPADVDYPMGFNILETENDEQKPLIASGLMGVFKKIWPDVWSPRMEYILMNCVLALLDYPGATLLGINRLLVDKEYRARVIAKLRDPIVKTFWVAEFTSWSEKYATEAIAPVQNKVGQFLSSSVIRNIVAQVKSTLNLRRIMDDGKILIVNLSKGRIGEDNMRLLGGMLITKLQLAAQERQNIPSEAERRDFYLFVDEFQNFANESFANILSEARKYRLNLTVAHQYIEQLDEKVTPAIFGNVGTLVTFRVGSADAEAMEVEFAPTFTPEDLVNLAKYNIYLKLMVDGMATPPFSAMTLPPIAERTRSTAKVVAVSRERYAESRSVIEAKVLQWSGMEAAGLPATMSVPEQIGGDVLLNGTPALQYPSLKTEEERVEEVVPVVSPVPSLTLEPVQEDTHEYLKITPERLAAIAANKPQGGGKSNRPNFPHTCTRCGKVWNLAIQLDPTRPMYCPECRPIVAEERKNKSSHMKQMMKEPIPPDEDDRVLPHTPPASGPNRPRVIMTEGRGLPSLGSEAKKRKRKRKKGSGQSSAGGGGGMMQDLAQQKGRPIETDKKKLEEQAGEPKGMDLDLEMDDPGSGQSLSPGTRVKF